MKKMAEILGETSVFSAGSAMCTIFWAPEWPHRSDFGPQPSLAGQRNLDLTSVFIRFEVPQRVAEHQHVCSFLLYNEWFRSFCITSTVKAVEGICDEKNGRTHLNTGAFLMAQWFVLFVEHQRDRTEVILDTSQVWRTKVCSTWPRCWGAKKGRWAPTSV